MTILERLRADHDEFRRLGQALEAIVRAPAAHQDATRVSGLAAEFKERLDAHSRIEDDVLYPAVTRALAPGSVVNQAFMSHLDSEHRKVDEYLKTFLEQVAGGRLQGGWAQTFALFSIGLRNHMKKEEEHLFPECEKTLGPALRTLGGEF